MAWLTNDETYPELREWYVGQVGEPPFNQARKAHEVVSAAVLLMSPEGSPIDISLWMVAIKLSATDSFKAYDPIYIEGDKKNPESKVYAVPAFVFSKREDLVWFYVKDVVYK